MDSDSQEIIFSAVFGDSDSDTDNQLWNSSSLVRFGTKYGDLFLLDGEELCKWEVVDVINGLWVCRSFLSFDQQQRLLEAIQMEGWFYDSLQNQAMRFGDLPEWAQELSQLIRICIQSHMQCISEYKSLSREPNKVAKLACFPSDNRSPLPSEILQREPLFDQMIVNSYQPGQGISAHVDLPAFEDGIAIVSLKSTCVMTFKRVLPSPSAENSTTIQSALGYLNQECAQVREFDMASDFTGSLDSTKGHTSDFHSNEPNLNSNVQSNSSYSGTGNIDVILRPGDLVLMHGPARYEWTHEINRAGDGQVWQGRPIVQGHRISVTLRRLKTLH